ncbi:MAG: hypothetical protein NTW13_04615, partial [Candidatus Omnitrophica bacterium]|nr:hypothetical protein [Candidatus Omnitrophota bacterium]
MARHKFPKIIYFLLCFLLIFQQTGFAQAATVELNIAGHLQSLHSNIFIEKFRPLHLRYLQYDELNNNFKLLLDKGDTKNPKTQDIESTTRDLLNYFFIGISLPNDTFWVNLRPDLPNNIIDPLLAQTEVGKILLESDLELKKDTARFTSPETPEGKEYWNKLYQKAEELYGSQNVTIPTLTRPWIVPDEIIIRESTDSAYVHKATLKVMLEQDYLKGNATYSFKDPREKELNEYSSQIIREKILPKLTKRINVSKDYAPLRQVYYSLILAQWFKARNQNKNTQYSRLIDRKDLSSLQSQTPYSVATYFNAYKENFEKGEYNIKEPTYTPYGQTIRSYFSGGLTLGNNITKQTTILPGSSGFWGGVKRSFLIALTASSLSANAANPAELAVIAQDSQTIGTSTSQTGKTPQGEKPVPQKITWNLNNRGEVEERLKTNSLKTILEVYKLAQQGDETAIKLLKDIAGGRYWGAADLSDRETAAGLLAKLAILDKKDKDLVLWILKLDISPEDTLRALGEAALLEESKFAIGFLKEMTEGKYPSLAPHIKGVALNYSIEYCIKKKDPDSVKWLLNNVIRHLSNKNKLNISEILIGKGTYEDIVKPLIYNENAPLELRIYALGLLPSEGTMELRVSLAKKLLETNKGIPTKALLEDESFWNQEIVKTYYLSVWFVISGHLLDMDNSKRQEKTNKFATEIISSVLLTQGARGVANNMLGINAKDTISHYPTLEIFFGVIAHEFSHRICTHHEAEYDRDASRLNNRAVNEFIADIGAYAFYEIMG